MKIPTVFLALIICSVFGYQKKQPELFVFDPDERLFTVFAFMNAAGFDGEWRKAGMHPIRKEISEYVKAKLDSNFQKKIREFHFSHDQGSWTGYVPYALLTNKPPDFEINYDPQTTKGGKDIENDYQGLSELLAIFYHQAEINKLWKKYRPLLQAENEKYKPFALKALDDIIKYCRADQDFYLRKARKIHFAIYPLMSYFTAQTAEVNGEIYIIHGPSEGEPAPSAFYHEALHHLIDPLTEKYLEIVNQSKELLPVSKEKSNLGYSDWQDVVNESFVRTIDKTLEGKLFNSTTEEVLKSIENEYKLGFILSLYIHENLSKYEKGNESFAEYFPKLISGIDVKAEKQRWSEFWHHQEN